MKKIIVALMLICICSSVFAETSVHEKEKIKDEYIKSYFISISAASCLGVYLPERSSEFDYMRDYGWEIVPHQEKSGGIETNFSVAHSYFSDIGKSIYLITFRGSASKNDWKINLETQQVPFEQKSSLKENKDKNIPAVHQGFLSYTDAVLKNSVLDENDQLQGIFQEVRNNPDAYMILTGHSLGGAVATLFGERLVQLGIPADKFAVITFGAPAVGNKAFAEQYGGKIDLTRITNTADPIPGSLQTFFGGYQQFGEHHKYHLSPTVSGIQHDMAMYFDQSVSEYFKKFDKAAAAGIIKKAPESKVTDDVPVVALWVTSSPGIKKVRYVPDIKRLLLNEYRMMLPSYVVMDKSFAASDIPEQENILSLSRIAGADYILICGIDGNKPKDKDYWYITLNQVLFDINGNMLNMSSFAKKVNPAAGNITAAGENIIAARKELMQQLPFLQTEHASMVYGF